MNNFLRFSDYDLFAYISSGMLAMLISDLALETKLVLGASWSVSEAVISVTGAYILGHLLAIPSASCLGQSLVHKILLPPSRVLLSDLTSIWRKFLSRTILRGYYRPLDPASRLAVKRQASRDGVNPESGEELFWCAFTIAKKHEATYARMETFLKLYGFCRNIAFVALAGSIILAMSVVLSVGSGSTSPRLTWAAIAFTAGVGMLHRYLKFYRHYGLEVILAYAGEGRSGRPAGRSLSAAGRLIVPKRRERTRRKTSAFGLI